MKAIVSREYGPPDVVLKPENIDPPVVGHDDVLVRVGATSVNPADWHAIRGEPYIARLSFGVRRPKNPVLGCDVAGVVDAVGKNVTTVRIGDEVFGSPFMRGFGTFAEYVRVPQDRLAHKPANLSFEQAASVPLAATTALQALRDRGRIKPGHRVLIIGASGGVGTFAVQIAKSFDAEVTGVCSTRNVDLVRSLGADHVIDYTNEDFTRGEKRYDLVLQGAGVYAPSDCRRVLVPKGILVQISGDGGGPWIGPIGRMVGARVLSAFVGQTLTSINVKPNTPDLAYLTELIEAGAVTPVIDRTYSLSDVPEAIGYLETGRARGKVVIAGDSSA